MPVMHIHYPSGALDASQKSTLAGRLTDALLDMEGGARTDGGRAFATVLFTPVASGDWWVGGRDDESYVSPPGRFLVRVSIPEGYMDQRHKSSVHRAVNAAICDAYGGTGDPKLGANILVTIEEVTEGNWGAAGRTISLASIAETVGLSKTSDRFRWVLEYFAAKTRAFRAAGYPAGTGGLLPTALETSDTPVGASSVESR
jgi:phenylpyruvate tautomerase PptA (4-oxalocrotonate tautomerase family)